MKKNARDNLAKFFYDGGKLSLAVLVIGLVARSSFSMWDLAFGIVFTLLFVTFGLIIDFIPAEEAK